MIEKIIKYEIKMSVPSSQISSHQKKFENLLHKAINTGQGMKQTNIVSVLMGKRWKPWQKLVINGKNGKEVEWFSQMVLGDNWWRTDGAD